MPDRPLVIAAANRKGGASKTSLVLHLSGASSSRGQPTLVIDLDPQGSATQAFGGSQFYEQLADREAVTALFDDSFTGDPATLIRPTRFANLFYLPASNGLGRLNYPDPSAQGLLQDAVRHFLAEVGDRFRMVWIDTPPSLELLTWSAMVAADHVVTPLIPEDFSAQGLLWVKRFIEEVRATRNDRLNWLGLSLQLVQPRLGVHIAYQQVLRRAYGSLVFDTVIPAAAPIKEAIANRAPITLYKPRVAGAKLYQQLFDEILSRVYKHRRKEAA
jgi:chromosome partitioning protein